MPGNVHKLVFIKDVFYYVDLSVDPGMIELFNSLKVDPPKNLYIFLVKTNFKLRDYYSVGTFVL